MRDRQTGGYLRKPIAGQDEERYLTDNDAGDGAKFTCAHKKPNWILRCIRKIKRYFQRRRAEKKKEDATDRAARSTANATWAIAFLTIVTICVGISQYVIFGRQLSVMQGQLNEMEASQRPWVSVEATGVGPIQFTKPLAAWIPFSITLKNVGHSPTMKKVSKFTQFKKANFLLT